MKLGKFLFGMGQKSNYHLIGFFAFMAMAIFSFAANSPVEGMMMLSGGAGAALTADEQKLVDAIAEKRNEAIKKANSELKAELEKEFGDKLSGLAKKEDLKDFDAEELKALKDELKKLGLANADIKNILTEQGKEMNTIKEKGLLVQGKAKSTNGIKEQVASLLKHIFETDDYKKFANNSFNGSTEKYTLLHDGTIKENNSIDKERHEIANKATSVSSDHTGSVLIADVRDNIRDLPLRDTHIRDLMPRTLTAGTSIVAPEVYNYTDVYTMGATMLGENTEAGESAFKTKENTWTLKRIARALPVSKRYFKTNGLNWVMNWILQRLPDQIQFVEDFQMLFGDGAGNNVNGITKNAQSFSLTQTYAADSIDSVASYDGGDKAIVTFASAHNLKNGDSLTIANATESTYNATHENVVVQDATSVVIDLTYVAEADTSAWTGTGTSYWYQSIDNAQEFDVLSVAKALLNAGEYMATGAVLHSSDVEKLGLLKGTDAHYVGVSRDASGRLNVNAMPIAVTNAMPAGHFLVGDFQRAVELAEYTPLSIQMSEDTTDKKKNQVTVIAEEEFIMPLYNPYWFMYGKFSDAKTALETA